MSTVALCALLLASFGDGEEQKQTRTIEEINDLNANKERVDDDLLLTPKERLQGARDAEELRELRAQKSASDLVTRLNLEEWPLVSRRAAGDMVARFGDPDEATDDKLIWKDAGTFKKIMVSRETTAHSFPARHSDVLTYVVDYKVPPSRFDDLAYFDGSVHADRTKGELSVRCDRHEMNIVALNLADDIIRGKRTVAAARQALASVQRRVAQNDPPPIARRLQFDATRTATADPDRPVNSAMGR
jgi:hypothetical protein